MGTITGGDLIALITGGVVELTGGGDPSPPATPSEDGTTADTELLAAAFDVLDELGKTLTYTQYAAQTHTPGTGEVSLGSPTTVNRKSIPPYQVEDRYIDGDLIQRGDMITGIAAKNLTFTPNKDNLVSVDSAVWKIKCIKPIYSGVSIALYLFILGK